MSEFDYSWHNLAKIFLIHNNVVIVVVAMDDIHCQEYIIVNIVTVRLCYLLITFSISSLSLPFFVFMLRMSLLIWACSEL